jgi:hypothetical protein
LALGADIIEIYLSIRGAPSRHPRPIKGG